MAGKKSSTPYTAKESVAVEMDGGWRPATARQAGEGAEGACGREDPKDPAEAPSDETTHQPVPRQPALESRSTMASQRPSHDRKVPRGMLDRSLQAQLGRQLRSIYSDIANEPVPDRFVKLLEELEAKEKPR
jgi:hypothetical protein